MLFLTHLKLVIEMILQKYANPGRYFVGGIVNYSKLQMQGDIITGLM